MKNQKSNSYFLTITPINNQKPNPAPNNTPNINKHTPKATLLVDKNLERSERFLSTITLYKLLLFFNANFNIYISSHSSKRML